MLDFAKAVLDELPYGMVDDVEADSDAKGELECNAEIETRKKWEGKGKTKMVCVRTADCGNWGTARRMLLKLQETGVLRE